MKIKINDGFVEYEYELLKSSRYSIGNIVDIIVDNSGMIATEGKIVKSTIREAQTKNEQLERAYSRIKEDARRIGKRRNYDPYLGDLAVLHRLDDDLEISKTKNMELQVENNRLKNALLALIVQYESIIDRTNCRMSYEFACKELNREPKQYSK